MLSHLAARQAISDWVTATLPTSGDDSSNSGGETHDDRQGRVVIGGPSVLHLSLVSLVWSDAMMQRGAHPSGRSLMYYRDAGCLVPVANCNECKQRDASTCPNLYSRVPVRDPLSTRQDVKTRLVQES